MKKFAFVFAIAALAAVAGASNAQAFMFNTDLNLGSTVAPDVAELQTVLESGKYLTMPVGVAKGYFGALTQSAVKAWQAAVGLPSTGFFGPLSRAKLNGMGGTPVVCPTGVVCTPTTPVTPVACPVGYTCTPAAGGTLSGGAGSIEDADFVSGINGEEVGEGSEDIKVASLEIEADGSDIELAAITINFDQVSAGSDFEDYASEVSVWFDGEEIARLDADEFSDDDDFNSTVSLDGGSVIKEGDTGEISIAVSGASNLDSDDIGDTWNVGVESVRFEDAQGAIITDNSTGDIGDADDDTTTDTDEVGFEFASFASAADLELKVSIGDDEINDSRTIQVDSENDTDGEEVLSFEVEVEGDADVTIDDLSVDFTSVGAGVGEIINDASIYTVDGDLIGGASTTIASTTATTMTVTFDNLDWTVKAGDKIEVIVKVDINDLGGAFTEGDTLTADVNPDDTAWDVEDEEGDDVAAADKTGAATSEAHKFFEEGVSISNPEADTSITEDTNGDTAGGKRGIYSIDFDVTAFEGDIYIPFGATVSTSSVDTDDGIAYAIENSDGSQISLNGSGFASTTDSVSSTANTSGNYFVVRQGDTETFTLNVTLVPTADGYFRVQVYGVNFNVGSAAAADTQQTATPASEYETGAVNIDV